MSVRWGEGPRSRVGEELAQQVADRGYRLGVIVENGDHFGEHEASALLTSVGLLPSRRLARLHPRHGETLLRSADLADFGRRYGHEYVVALLRMETFPVEGERDEIEGALQGEGCDVLWH